MYRLALLSIHGCPVARLGERDTGGMNVYVLQTARALARMGNAVDVYTRWHDPNDPQIVSLGDNVRVIHLKVGPYDRNKEALYQDIPALVSDVLRFQRAEGLSYDLVHSHYWLSGAAGMTLSRVWGIPHVTTFHTLARRKMQVRAGESESQIRGDTEGRVMKSADAVVVSTDQERDDMARLYGASPHKAEVIAPGVDTTLFRPLDKAPARQALGLKEGRIVLSVGRIEPLKGLDILIRAMARLEDPVDTRLLIVGGNAGSDPEVERLKSVAAEEGVLDVVSFTGRVDQTDLPTYYNAADVFVLSSYYETFGLVALEAMACGVPVIASRVGGPRTFITESKTGYLIHWRCPDAYALRLDVLLANPGLRESMGSAARAKAGTMSWDEAADRMLDVYGSVIGTTWARAVGE